MVNFGFNSASILGIFLAVAGGGLYLLRSLRPEVSRDHDIFFAAVGLLCGGILLWHGWRLDPILQFSQLLLAGSAVFFAIETIRLRGATNEQARRSNPYVEEDRPVSKVYRAELAQVDGYGGYEEEDPEDIPRRRRLEGSADRPSARRSSYVEDAPRPRKPRRSSSPPSEVPRGRRPSPRSGYDEDWQDTPDHWEDNPPRRGSTRGDRRPPREEDYRPPSRPGRRPPSRRPKSAEDIVSSVGTEYVDYQPIDEESFTPEDYPENDRDYPDTDKNIPPNSPDIDY